MSIMGSSVLPPLATSPSLNTGGGLLDTLKGFFGGSESIGKGFDASSFTAIINNPNGFNFGSLASSFLKLNPTTAPYVMVLDIVGLDVTGFINNTIGNVFTDGLSCWGSTFTSSKVENEIRTIHAPYWQNEFLALQNAENINAFNNRLNIIAEGLYTCFSMYNYIQTSANWRSCSRKALKKFLDFYTPLFNKFKTIEDALEQQYIVTKTDAKKNPSTHEFVNYNFSWTEKTQTTYPIYKLKGRNIFSSLKMANSSILVILLVLGSILKNIFDNKKAKKPTFEDVLRLPING